MSPVSKAPRGKKKSAPALSLRPLRLPAQTHQTLSNGLQVTAVPRGPLPMVSIRLVTRAGSVLDPIGKFGVTDLAARLLRRGAGGKSANELSDAVDLVGAGLSAWASEDSFGVSLTTPAKHFVAMLELMALVTLEPDFPEAELELARRRLLSQITNSLDDPDALADRAQIRAVWGDHPYGHETVGHEADLMTITRDDLIAAHRQQLAPSVSSLFIVGAVDTSVALSHAERLFSRWQGTAASRVNFPQWNKPVKAGQVVIVDKPEQTQVQVRLTSAGIARGNPDHFPLSVMNTVLGGGFTSRLVTQIRVKRGLTYGAGSHFDQMAAAGTFNVSSFTKTESVGELIDVALAELQKMKSKGPNAVEVATVQRYIAGLYPARLETNDAVAGALADMRLFDLPADWVDQYRERVAAVTVAEAAAAAKKYLPSEPMLTVLVGNAEKLKKPAAKYGEVTVVTPPELA